MVQGDEYGLSDVDLKRFFPPQGRRLYRRPQTREIEVV
jgi:hypothetical protein